MRSEGSSSNTSSSSTRGILDKLSTIALCHSDTVLEGEDEVVIVPDSRTENYESSNANYNIKVIRGRNLGPVVNVLELLSQGLILHYICTSIRLKGRLELFHDHGA